MKSIVLCERTLLQESENFSTLKEESNEKAEEKKILNGIPDGKKSESDVDNFKKGGITLQNGDKSSKTPFQEEETEIYGKNRQPSMESDKKSSTNYFTSEKDAVSEVTKSGSGSEADETDCLICEVVSSESKTLKNVEAQDSFASVEDPDTKSNMNLSVEIDDDSVDAKDMEKSGNSLQCTDDKSPKKRYDSVIVDEKDSKTTEIKDSMQPMEDIILDMDENKENEKEEKTNNLEDYSGNDLNKHPNECEIQVGDVQTISGPEKDSMWAENDLKKCEQNLNEKSEEKLMVDCEDRNEESNLNEESMGTIVDEKEDENHETGGEETVTSEAEENVEEGMHIEVEENEQTEELKVIEKENGLTDFSTGKNITHSEDGDNKTSDVEAESSVCRKRQISDSNDEDPSAKKKRLLKDADETNQVQSVVENAEDSSRFESLASLGTTSASSEGQLLSEAKLPTKKRISTDEKNPKKLKPSDEKEESEVKKHQAADAMVSVLEKFRGTLKTLTRSDLEELIVQKLCEVITERSNVGELRRKAQALEQDQERWKAKAQSLTKQMREMEMVMKKYMTEVQKQIKDGDSHVVTPLKVTRSVGLQVSFYSSANKGPKPSLPQSPPSNLPQNTNVRNVKGPSQKLPSQYSPAAQSMRNKSAPSSQKGSPSPQKSPVPPQRRPIVPKPDYPSTPANRPVAQQAHVNSPRGVQNQGQVPRSNFKSPVAASPQQQSQSHQQQQQPQQQQNGSKVIDLTDDDDRQTGNVVVKASGPIRVVNHLTQTPTSQNNRFAYLLPTTSTSTGTSAGQGRQVLIATPTMPQPNRQIMCSMPPLLFKGGNVVQSGSQPQMLNQSNKVILPKTLRHPAPLPKRPLNQNTRPSLKLLPPRPALKISKVQTGIVLSWNMALSQEHAPIASYQLYAYQESDTPPATSLWKKVGDVKALPLPMACTLTQFMSGHKYHFAVRAVDLHSRIGPFSFPGTIVLV